MHKKTVSRPCSARTYGAHSAPVYSVVGYGEGPLDGRDQKGMNGGRGSREIAGKDQAREMDINHLGYHHLNVKILLTLSLN